MKKLKKLIIVIVLSLLTIAVLTFFSLENEKQHLENCASLGVKCEKGQIQQSVEKLITWFSNWINPSNNQDQSK